MAGFGPDKVLYCTRTRCSICPFRTRRPLGARAERQIATARGFVRYLAAKLGLL